MAAKPLSKGLQQLLNTSKNPPVWLRSLAKQNAERRARWFAEGAPFPVGQKKIFLPKFVVSLLRTPRLSPKWAQFEVPLSFNKLDMRDYLYHAYDVRVRSVRSFITYQPITARLPNSKGNWPGKRQFHRPRSKKRMTVELEKPFVWPDPPEDYTPWEQNRFQSMTESFFPRDKMRQIYDQIKLREKELKGEDEQLRKEMLRRREPKPPKRYNRLYHKEVEHKYKAQQKEMRERAQAYLSGKAKWGVDPSLWESSSEQSGEQASR